MNSRYFLFSIVTLAVLFVPLGSLAQVTEVGTVTAVADGTLYIEGIAHSIATVRTRSGVARVAVPSMGMLQPVQAGETLSFAGPLINVNSQMVVNTRSGVLFRSGEKSYATYMQDMMAKARSRSESAAKSGIPNAVPTMLIESKEQAKESSAKRRNDLLIGLLSLIVALLAFERMQRLATAPWQWVKAKIFRSVKKEAPQKVV